MRVLVATVPLTGHVHPMLLVVQALIARGHEVIWYGSAKFAAKIAATGAKFAPMTLAPDWDDNDVDAALPALRGKRGLARVKAQLHEMFIAPMVDQLRDLEQLVDAHGANVVLADQAHLGAALVAEKRRIPWAGLGISALVVPSVDTAPFGSARPPAKNDVDRTIYRWLGKLIHRWLFRSVNRAFWQGRMRAGLPAGDKTYFDVLAKDLFLQPTIPAFEYPRSDLPHQVRFIGPLVPADVSTDPLPLWWSDIAAARKRGAPVILVTQGTLANNPTALIAPALRGLASEDALIIATTSASPHDAGMSSWPENARVASYIPYQRLLPHVSAIVTNGGYGGVQMALRHGVPLVVAGGTEEKPEIAARVAWAGVGINLRTGTPRARAVWRAVRRVLGEPHFTTRVRALAEECGRYDAPNDAAAHLEQLVHRSNANAGTEAA